MKGLARSVFFESVALFLTSQVLSGLSVRGGIITFLIGGFALSLINFIVKPILTLLSFPLNMITFGLFSFVTNALILYILTVFVPQIVIHQFSIPRLSFAGFVTPYIHLNLFFAFVTIAMIVSAVFSFEKWLTASQ